MIGSRAMFGRKVGEARPLAELLAALSPPPEPGTKRKRARRPAAPRKAKAAAVDESYSNSTIT